MLIGSCREPAAAAPCVLQAKPRMCLLCPAQGLPLLPLQSTVRSGSSSPVPAGLNCSPSGNPHLPPAAPDCHTVNGRTVLIITERAVFRLAQVGRIQNSQPCCGGCVFPAPLQAAQQSPCVHSALCSSPSPLPGLPSFHSQQQQGGGGPAVELIEVAPSIDIGEVCAQARVSSMPCLICTQTSVSSTPCLICTQARGSSMPRLVCRHICVRSIPCLICA